ncbi:MAG: FecR domain-containing protein [Proteobacteria bacterium]|nr:FecR domain-containing protein [Pseudomonadota bacterium]
MSDEKNHSNVADAPPSIALSDQAIEHLVHLHSGRATAQDRLAFRQWRQRTPAHEAAAAEAEALLTVVGQTRQADALRLPPAPVPFRTSARPMGRRTMLAGGAGVAAAAAAAFVVMPSLPPLAALYADYTTAVGERRRVDLADGSVAYLNTGTALSVDYTAQARRLTLHQGQALFEVAKNPNRPFIVAAEGMETQALGTTFSVRRTGSCANVVVSEGVVEVRVGADAGVRLEAGQKYSFGSNGPRKLRTVDVERATAWQRGKLIFNSRPLGQVVTELQRYQKTRIVIVDDGLKALRVTGVFDLDHPEHLLRAVVATTKARITHLPLVTLIT